MSELPTDFEVGGDGRVVSLDAFRVDAEFGKLLVRVVARARACLPVDHPDAGPSKVGKRSQTERISRSEQ